MSSGSQNFDIAAWLRRGRTRSDKAQRFTQQLERMNFKDKVQALDQAANLGGASYAVGFRTAHGAEPACHIAIVQCRSAPKTASVPAGWRLVDQSAGNWWEYSQSGTTVQVLFNASDKVTFEAIVGSCIGVKGYDTSGYLTQGLIVRDNRDGSHWGLNVGHEFVGSAQQDPANAIFFCNPTPDNQQCKFCAEDKCATCGDATAHTPKTKIAEGNDIFTTGWKQLYPEPSEWMDFGTYKIPTDKPVLPLDVRMVHNDIEKLAAVDKNAHDELIKLTDTAAAPMASDDLEELAYKLQTANKELYLFKKGKKSGWTFGRLVAFMVTGQEIFIDAIGKTTEAGDCGAIWFALNPENGIASPVSYHYGKDEVYLRSHAFMPACLLFCKFKGMSAEDDFAYESSDSYIYSKPVQQVLVKD